MRLQLLLAARALRATAGPAQQLQIFRLSQPGARRLFTALSKGLSVAVDSLKASLAA